MNSRNKIAKWKTYLKQRWSAEDYPGGFKRFQIHLPAKDLLIFVGLPIAAVVSFKMLESSVTSPRRIKARPRIDVSANSDPRSSSQILRFAKVSSSPRGKFGVAARPVGTIARVRLLNAVETLSSAPVHVQLIDQSLGPQLYGATVIGDATAEGANDRVAITFKFAKLQSGSRVGIPLSARALSLDGTFAVAGKKKEGFFARAVVGSASSSSTNVDTTANDQNLKTLIARMVAGGLMQEFKNDASVANANAQVLSLDPGSEFLIELTDNFPSQQ